MTTPTDDPDPSERPRRVDLTGLGRVERRDGHLTLVHERRFTATVDDVWRSLTEPQRLERWVGTWEGTPTVGGTVRFTMTAEEGATPEDVVIRTCDPPHRFAGDFDSEAGSWHIAFELREDDGTTVLEFTQRLTSAEEAGSSGPGWEYYLDRLEATFDGQPFADWADYLPQSEHFLRAARDVGAG